MAETAPTIKEYLAAPAVMKRTEEMLKERSSQFVTSVLALAGADPALMASEPRSLFNACLTAAALNLPINKNLGFAHIIPYKNSKKQITEAQFQMGWKGFVQLAQRSGQYKTISATEVYEGQLVKSNPLLGNTYNWDAKTSDTVIGYVAIFVLTNGFEHELYMSKSQMEAHAKRYSQAFKANYGPWKDDFNVMGLKTVIKLNVSKYGPMSVEMENALVRDQAVIRGDNDLDYIDGTDLLDDEKATPDQKQAIIDANITDDGELVKTEAAGQAAEAFKAGLDEADAEQPTLIEEKASDTPARSRARK